LKVCGCFLEALLALPDLVDGRFSVWRADTLLPEKTMISREINSLFIKLPMF